MEPAKLNYPVRKLELLAIMHDLRVWRVYHRDRPFTVITDHKSIEMILTQKKRIGDLHDGSLSLLSSNHCSIDDALSQKSEFERNAAQVGLQELLDTAQNREIVAPIVPNKVTVAKTAKAMYLWNRELQWIIKELIQGDTMPKYSLQDTSKIYCDKNSRQSNVDRPRVHVELRVDHGLSSIISDRDSKITSTLWQSIVCEIGTQNCHPRFDLKLTARWKE
ncbi:hypothetical protein CCR75_002372 [Bremia lactucae]|uniref:Reverse transcriptase RNase H-like domain-containing protein n=1 Tax=Bremia lactucae TaxID=4779 RepID=A0A976FNH4_BRELC|nr:hypothetical protein CCR75_002372 [Bremia lactucae]